MQIFMILLMTLNANSNDFMNMCVEDFQKNDTIIRESKITKEQIEKSCDCIKSILGDIKEYNLTDEYSKMREGKTEDDERSKAIVQSIQITLNSCVIGYLKSENDL